MNDIVYSLYPEKEAKAIKSLLSDDSIRMDIKKEIGKKIISTDEVIIGDTFNQFMVITSLAPFANSEEECVSVAKIVHWGIKKTTRQDEYSDILPLISEHNGAELAYRCLISLSFFEKTLIRMYEHRGAPMPNTYRQAGKQAFILIGEEDISKHFKQWEYFLKEMFAY